jgi:hypothetical protein
MNAYNEEINISTKKRKEKIPEKRITKRRKEPDRTRID